MEAKISCAAVRRDELKLTRFPESHILVPINHDSPKTKVPADATKVEKETSIKPMMIIRAMTLVCISTHCHCTEEDHSLEHRHQD